MTNDEKLKIRLAEAMGLHCTFPHLLPKKYYYKKEDFICSQIFDPEHNVLDGLAAVEALVKGKDDSLVSLQYQEYDQKWWAYIGYANDTWSGEAKTIEAALWGALKQYTETNF